MNPSQEFDSHDQSAAHPAGSESPREKADRLIQELDQELVLKRSARAMRRQHRTVWRLILVVLIAGILLFAAYALVMLDRTTRGNIPTGGPPGGAASGTLR